MASADNEEGTKMAFIEVYATPTRRGGEYPSKAAIKRDFAQDPASVMFISVGGLGPQWSGTAAEYLAFGKQTGTKLTLVGPNPYTKRNYYGTVQVKAGKVVIS